MKNPPWISVCRERIISCLLSRHRSGQPWVTWKEIRKDLDDLIKERQSKVRLKRSRSSVTSNVRRLLFKLVDEGTLVMDKFLGEEVFRLSEETLSSFKKPSLEQLFF